MATMARDFFVRTDDELGEALEKQASTEGRSVSNLIRLAISRYLREAGALPDVGQGDKTTTEEKRPARKPKK
jgi:predicted DNA-binding protein